MYKFVALCYADVEVGMVHTSIASKQVDKGEVVWVSI